VSNAGARKKRQPWSIRTRGATPGSSLGDAPSGRGKNVASNPTKIGWVVGESPWLGVALAVLVSEGKGGGGFAAKQSLGGQKFNRAKLESITFCADGGQKKHHGV